MKRVYRKSQPHEQMYAVINKHGEVYAGMIQGDLQWSYDWSQAKPLYNKAYYEACDLLMGISKQTVNINKLVLDDKADNECYNNLKVIVAANQYSYLN